MPPKASALTSYWGIGFAGDDKHNQKGLAAPPPPPSTVAELRGQAHAAASYQSSQLGAPTTATGTTATPSDFPIKQGLGFKSVDPAAAKEKVNKDILAKVKETFQKADSDGSGRLGPDEFIKAFVGILQTEDGGDADSLGKLFMRIDANSDGTIDWDEFSSYMLLESQGSASIRDMETSINFEQPEEAPVREEFWHKDTITHIAHVTLANGADRYVSCGKDGLVKIWNAKDMSHIKTISTGKSWVTCARLLPVTKKLAVSSFSRSMKIYDMHTFEMCGQIPEIDYPPMSMDVWVPHRNKDVEMIVFGDGGGFVRLYEVRVNPLEDKNSADRYLDIPKWKYQHHNDWVTSVKYVEDMNAVVAGSLDRTVSITDAEERVPLKVLEGHTKGVNCVDWSPVYKFVVSGGQDRRVLLWNPFSQKPLAQLQGHVSSVMQVVVNDRDNQIITLGADKTVKLWDIRNHMCIQTMADREVYINEDTLMAMAYDAKRKTLITGNTKPKLWRQTISASASAGHRAPIVRIMFNPHFNEAVSGDQSGTVSVWHIPTGKLRFRFHRAHGDKQMTAMAFDTANRRLMTGCENGEVKVWNFSSGACLCTLKPRTREEVTCMLGIRGSLMKHFLVAGWDRKVTFFEDPGPGQKESLPGRIISGHQADILDMAILEGSPTVVTAADDGELIAWNIESGAMKRKMVAEGLDEIPTNELAIECVRFLKGNLKHVAVTVSADRFLRAWDVASGTCLAELFTGHKMGESVTALAVDAANTRIATGDSGGFVKVWDSSAFTGQRLCDWDEAADTFPELALWRAHSMVVSSADIAQGPAGVFILTSSHDRTVSMWSENGAHVGMLGAAMWLWEAPESWKTQKPYPLEPRDAFEMEVSRQRPARKRRATKSRSPPRESAVTLLAPTASSGRDPGAASKLGKLASFYGGVSFRHKGAGGEGSGLMAGPLSGGPEAQQGAGYGHRGSTTGGGAPRVSIAGAFARPGSAASTGTVGGGGSRPTTAPESVARVLKQSHTERMRRVESVRRIERPNSGFGGVSSRPGSGVGGGMARAAAAALGSLGLDGDGTPRPGTAGSVASGASPLGGRAMLSGRAAGGVSRTPQQAWTSAAAGSVLGSTRVYANPDEDDEVDDDNVASESNSSSDHESDDDVPKALWLQEFELARKRHSLGLHTASSPHRDVYQPAGAKGLNHPWSAGRKDTSYAHLMHVSELKKVQGQSPSSSSRASSSLGPSQPSPTKRR